MRKILPTLLISILAGCQQNFQTDNSYSYNPRLQNIGEGYKGPEWITHSAKLLRKYDSSQPTLAQIYERFDENHDCIMDETEAQKLDKERKEVVAKAY